MPTGDVDSMLYWVCSSLLTLFNWIYWGFSFVGIYINSTYKYCLLLDKLEYFLPVCSFPFLSLSSAL